ncbi:response regulator transcription factor [Micromonospora ureilytica]|uniref:response regulator transcription factor n=1 Tax=Micromonospora ureilytica TaxID=709868 RepID=UPI002E143C15
MSSARPLIAAEKGDERSVSVAIADVHPLLSGMLNKLFSQQWNVEVVAHVTSMAELVDGDAWAGCPVDVLILHVAQVDSAIETAVRSVAAGSGTHVMVVSGSESDDEMVRCLRSGARGYFGNNADFDSLCLAVGLVARGGTGITGSAASRLAALAGQDMNRAPSSAKGLLDSLTNREREVVALLVDGQNNRGIARRLNISERTVRNHLSRIFFKLGVQDRLRAALVARKLMSLSGDFA